MVPRLFSGEEATGDLPVTCCSKVRGKRTCGERVQMEIFPCDLEQALHRSAAEVTQSMRNPVSGGVAQAKLSLAGWSKVAKTHHALSFGVPNLQTEAAKDFHGVE